MIRVIIVVILGNTIYIWEYQKIVVVLKGRRDTEFISVRVFARGLEISISNTAHA